MIKLKMSHLAFKDKSFRINALIIMLIKCTSV